MSSATGLRARQTRFRLRRTRELGGRLLNRTSKSSCLGRRIVRLECRGRVLQRRGHDLGSRLRGTCRFVGRFIVNKVGLLRGFVR